MQFTKVTYERKVQPRQFESLGVVVEVTLAAGESPELALETLTVFCEMECAKAVAYVNGEEVRRIYASEKTSIVEADDKARKGVEAAEPPNPPSAHHPSGMADAMPEGCSIEGCLHPVTNGQRAVSSHVFGRPLCLVHQKESKTLQQGL